MSVFVVCSRLQRLVCSNSCTVFQDDSPPLPALLPWESAVCGAGESPGGGVKRVGSIRSLFLTKTFRCYC